MRCILFLLVVALAVPAVAAEEGESAEPSSEPSSSEAGPSEDDSTDGGALPEPPEPDTTCQAYQLNGFSRPVYGWVTIDPDGCYRRLLDRVIPPYVSVHLWMLP